MHNEKGWVKLYRKIKDNWLWDNKKPKTKFEAWIDILLTVNHQDRTVFFRESPLTCKRGETITSELKLAKEWKWSRKKTRNFLETLEKEQMIVLKRDKRKTVISVINYDKYQDSSPAKDTTEGQVRIQQRDINKN